MGKRSNVDIVREILDSVSAGRKKTNIMYQCNLIFVMLKLYTDALVESGSLTLNGNLYHLTPKGESILQKAKDLKQSMEQFYRCLEKKRSI